MEEATVLAFGSARAAALRSRRFCLQGCKYIAERREKVRSRSGRETGLGMRVSDGSNRKTVLAHCGWYICAPSKVYSHGHHESVLRSRTWAPTN